MMMKNDIKVEVKCNAEDYRRVLFWYQWKRHLSIGVIWLLIVFIALYTVGSGAGCIWLLTNKTAPYEFFALLLALPLMTSINFYFGIWRRAKKIAQISGLLTVTFSENGVKSDAELASSERSWKKFDKVYETKKEFIFFPQDNVFYTIPFRFFLGDSQLQDMKSILREKLGKRAKLRS